MKEIKEIIKASERIKQSGETAVLATIVSVVGSHYRKPGAKMLITRERKIAGSISGGCFEVDLFERAQKVMETNLPVLLNYDTTSDDEIILGTGTGCGGHVKILLEPFPNNLKLNPVDFLKNCLEHKQKGIIATLFSIEGSPDLNVGDRCTVGEDYSISADFKETSLIDGIKSDAKKIFSDSKSSNKTYNLAQGNVEVFLEYIKPPMSLALFGAGDDAVPLVTLARELGWDVTVIDHRSSYAVSERFPKADSIIVSDLDSVGKNVPIKTFTAAVILTHNFLNDLKLLKTLLPVSLKYLGLLGSRKRAKLLIEELHKHGMKPTDEQLRHFYFPAGLDIGSETPVEIALSIISEINSVLCNRQGGFLRNKK